jgi:nucleotide-binding universal stress UspA family protein
VLGQPPGAELGGRADGALLLVRGREEKCDLIAMTTDGHRFLSDLIHGTTISKVRHETDLPVFLVKAPRE